MESQQQVEKRTILLIVAGGGELSKVFVHRALQLFPQGTGLAVEYLLSNNSFKFHEL